MIPLRDLNPTRTRAVLTYVVIAVNVLVFLYQSQLGPAAERAFVLRHGVIPYLLAGHLRAGSLTTPISSMFMHGGWMHLLGNMWMLHIFGDNVEDALGKLRFLAFYLLCGVAAALAHVFVEPGSPLPLIGASGAIAGVLAGYVRLYPNARVVTLIPIFFIFITRELPAVFFIFLWFGLQVLLGLQGLEQASAGGIAFFAHVGGFVAGYLLIKPLLPPRNQTGGWQPTPTRRAEGWR